METQQANPAVVTIQDTVVELEKLVELFSQYSPEKTCENLTPAQLEAIGKNLYTEAFQNNSLAYLARYVANEFKELFLSSGQASSEGKDELVYQIANSIESSQYFKNVIVDRLINSCFDPDSIFVERIADRVMNKIVERMSTSTFKLVEVALGAKKDNQ